MRWLLEFVVLVAGLLALTWGALTSWAVCLRELRRRRVQSYLAQRAMRMK